MQSIYVTLLKLSANDYFCKMDHAHEIDNLNGQYTVNYTGVHYSDLFIFYISVIQIHCVLLD